MSTTTITFTLTDDAGTPVDADSTPVLRDPAAAYGVKRTDTAAVVVAAGTAMVRDSAGTYHYTFTDPAAGLTYAYAVEFVYQGETNWYEGNKDGGDTAWHYADQDAVEAEIGATALRQISNEPDAADPTSTSTSRVLAAGQWADAYMDARLKSLGYVTPLEATDAGTDLLMRSLNAKLTAWKLNEPRMLMSLSGGRNANALDKIMSEHRAAAEKILADIQNRRITITATRLYSRPPFAKVSVPTAAERLTDCA